MDVLFSDMFCILESSTLLIILKFLYLSPPNEDYKLIMHNLQLSLVLVAHEFQVFIKVHR